MAQLVQDALDLLWLFLPGMTANMAPVFAAKIPAFAKYDLPLSKRYLGDNKTWRGLWAGLVGGALVSYLQWRFVHSVPLSAEFLALYSSAGKAVGIGVWLAFGALAGDAVKSFLKRRSRVGPGQPWRPWDQIDYVLGMSFVAVWFAPLTVAHLMLALILLGAGSYTTSFVGVKLGIKKSV